MKGTGLAAFPGAEKLILRLSKMSSDWLSR